MSRGSRVKNVQSRAIPEMIQESVLAALVSWPFDPHKWPPISNREPFVRRLRLIKIPGASFAKTDS